jgi:hypothetical protein
MHRQRVATYIELREGDMDRSNFTGGENKEEIRGIVGMGGWGCAMNR